MSKPIPPVNITHTCITKFAACNPMNYMPDRFCLRTNVGGVEISATSHAECRGLTIGIEESPERIQELAFTHPVAIRNAVYAVVNAMGEPLRFLRVESDLELPPWFEFAADRQADEG